MTSPSPAGIQQQFQTPDWRQSNLDHCNQCGATRAAHGPDWTCPARPARANAAVWLALAIVLTAGGVIAQVFAHANQAMQNAAAAGILAGAALLVAAVIMVVRSK
jgi:hypothetical protein